MTFPRRVTLNDEKFIEMSKRIAPGVGIQDAPTRCFRVNLEWCKFVAGAMSELLNVQAWENVDDENSDIFQQIMEMLEGENCMDCTDVLDCVNSDSDYLALQGAIFSQSQTTTQAHTQELNDQYDTTPQSIGANIPTDAPDATEQAALCYAISAYLELYAATKTGQIQSQNVAQLAWNRIRQAIHGAFNAFLDVLAPIYTPNLYDCFVSDTDAIAALADMEALDLVKCCLLDSLAVAVMSESSFNGAITSCATALTGNAGDIACLLSNDNNLDVYLMFLEVYNDVLQRQIDGESFSACDCSGLYPILIIGDDLIGCNLSDGNFGTLEYLGAGNWRITSTVNGSEKWGVFQEETAALFKITSSTRTQGSLPFRRWCTSSNTIAGGTFADMPLNTNMYGYRFGAASASAIIYEFHAEFA